MITDPYLEGMANGWHIVDGSRLENDHEDEADVLIIGSGAGGGIAAEILARSGLRVILLEEGPLKTTSDFRMRESDAYPQLYQESAARKTADKAINILQGRCVGGSTTVNWTSSFRTPPATLAYWQDRYGLSAYSVEGLRPWFEAVERRLGIAPWESAPNPNNETLLSGANRLGVATQIMRRNVRGCWNLGYCGTGCPTNAKQSMLVTCVPTALAHGARLYSRVRAERLLWSGDRITGLDCRAMDGNGIHARNLRLRFKARHFVVAAGAIGTPALLLRSAVPDPHELLGRRTFLHPTIISAALMGHSIAGHSGAPQSVYSDHYLDALPVEGPMAYKLESAPLHPVLFSSTLQGYGENHAELMQQFNQAQVLLALLRDGFHEQSRGGRVGVRENGAPVLDYPLNDFLWEAVRRALLSMAEIQFAAGAKKVIAVHEDCKGWNTLAEARTGIAVLRMQPLSMRVVSAHVMGGCPMGSDARASLLDGDGRYRHLANLLVADGSVFPTSIGANPQESVYGIAARNVSRLAAELSGRPTADLA